LQSYHEVREERQRSKRVSKGLGDIKKRAEEVRKLWGLKDELVIFSDEVQEGEEMAYLAQVKGMINDIVVLGW